MLFVSRLLGYYPTRLNKLLGSETVIQLLGSRNNCNSATIILILVEKDESRRTWVNNKCQGKGACMNLN